MRIGLAAVGFTSIIAQVLLMRELVATFYGNELLLGLVLAAWLAWVAAGSWGLARFLPPALAPSTVEEREEDRGRTTTFAAGLALAGVLLPAQIALVRGARTLLAVTPGALVEFGPMVSAVVLVLAPLCLLAGGLFALGTRLAESRGGSAGQAYVWESAGAVFGGALFGLVLLHWLDPLQSALLVAAVNLVVAVRIWPFGGSVVRSPIVSFLLLGVLLLGLFPLGRHLHTATLTWQWPDLIFTADSPYGRLTVQARDGQRVFFENGLLAFETQGTFPEEVAHFPLLVHPDPRDVLLIGGGVAGDAREILKHPVSSVTYVELDPLLIQAAQAHLPPEDAAVLSDPRVTLVLTDGRLHVKRTSETFDVVILDLPEPATGALNRFYTQEFFEEVRAILNPGGVFALGLPSAENYWSPELARRNGSVYHTLRASFPEVVVLPGEHNFFLASDIRVETDPAVLVGRLRERAVANRWVTVDYIEYVFTTDRFAQVQQDLRESAGVRLNRDLAPICYYYDLALWLHRLYPNLRGAFESASVASFSAGSWQALAWVVVPLALAVLVVRWRRRGAVPFSIGCIGLAEMTLQVVILFAFQTQHGTVYAHVSLIVTAFMAGLALGGIAGNRLLAGWGDEPNSSGGTRAKTAVVGIQAAVIICGAALPFILTLHVPAVLLLLLALLVGGLVGMAFPLAVALWRSGGSHAAGVLYAADLVGGCLGALLGAVLLVPVLGIPQTCAAVSLVGLAGLLASL